MNSVLRWVRIFFHIKKQQYLQLTGKRKRGRTDEKISNRTKKDLGTNKK